jgi:hypothetical protein
MEKQNQQDVTSMQIAFWEEKANLIEKYKNSLEKENKDY